MKRTFERELPEGYVSAYEIDAKKKSVGIYFTVFSAIMTVIAIVIAYFIIRPQNFWGNYSILRNLIFLFSMIAYVVLHELVHGAVYKLLTKEKLTFGLTLSVAYCGVPKIFVYRKTALAALLAPFVVFSIVFLGLAFLLPNYWDKFYACVIFAVHFGGCVGDLWCTMLYIFKFRKADTLLQDTGPKQTFYVK